MFTWGRSPAFDNENDRPNDFEMASFFNLRKLHPIRDVIHSDFLPLLLQQTPLLGRQKTD